MGNSIAEDIIQVPDEEAEGKRPGAYNESSADGLPSRRRHALSEVTVSEEL